MQPGHFGQSALPGRRRGYTRLTTAHASERRGRAALAHSMATATRLLLLLLLALAAADGGDIQVTGGVPVVAMNVSRRTKDPQACTDENVPGCRNYFPATLSWAGSELLLATNTESDDLHDNGMAGRAALSSTGGASWREMPQPLQQWQIEDCCLPIGSTTYGRRWRRQQSDGVSGLLIHAAPLQHDRLHTRLRSR
jgi:hypothetical protein